MSDLDGKTALVTGASSGIGLSTARLLEQRGATVYTAQRREGEQSWIAADFLDVSTPEHVINTLKQKETHLDILVNNAGIMREGTVEETNLNDWQDQINVNLTIPYLLIKHALPLMRENGGSIVNVGSIEGLGSNPRHPAYCASKGGLHALTRAVAVDHGPEGIRCNAVAPGWIDTPLNVDFINSLPDPDQFREKIGGIHPLRRTGTAEEVAELIVWLASDQASFMSGQILTLDGGRMAKLSLP